MGVDAKVAEEKLEEREEEEKEVEDEEEEEEAEEENNCDEISTFTWQVGKKHQLT